MTIWALSDLHLSLASDKPMDVFGSQWDRHTEKIESHWRRLVDPADTVLLAGDLSWGMNYEQALPDLQWVDRLPGKKVIIRGNHDYWWKKIKWLRENLPPSIHPLQNEHIVVEGRTVCGCRGWTIPVEGSENYTEDLKLFDRERIRLRLSLESAKERKDTIVMLHYPPMLPHSDEPGFSDILEAYDVRTVVYGHLHGPDAKNAFSEERNQIRYMFTSCDGVDFQPVQVV